MGTIPRLSLSKVSQKPLDTIGYKDYIFSVSGSNLKTLLMWAATTKNNANKSIHKSGVSSKVSSKNSHMIYYSEYGFTKMIHDEKFHMATLSGA